jgi:ribosomal protein L40E
MGLMEDMMKVLDRWDVWLEVKTVPSRVGELEATVKDLTEKLNGKWPADVCRSCGERGLRLKHKLGPVAQGNMREEWDCEKCGARDTRIVKPS